ncbi:HET-domain-containing protein [Phaeosphaeriaceae sp. SRC1lsM3a]|nr:HET-domain-containing protein [Stagonospora sp. SRC1lsM3a]
MGSTTSENDSSTKSSGTESGANVINNLCERCERHIIVESIRKKNDSRRAEAALPAPCDLDCGLCILFRETRRCENCKTYGPKTRGHFVPRNRGHALYFQLNSFCPSCYECSIHRLYPLSLEHENSGLMTANLASVKNWMDDCQVHHSQENSACVPSSIRPLSTALRIIDCQTRTVRLLRHNEPYVCLSYVWGSNVAADQHRGLGTQVGNDIPKTIDDAIYVAKQLNIPQLWVDQYCINQHDVRMRSATIQNMDVIYGGATLTIIAASGVDVYSGLPGVQEKQEQPQRVIRIDNQDLLDVEDVHQLIRTSLWHTRGWTYQEAVLSPRKLVFTKSQIYFQCSEAWYTKGIYHDIGELSGYQHPRFFPLLHFDSSSDALYERLEEYFPRQLTYGHDNVAAFEGVLGRFANYESKNGLAKHFYGIPLFRTEHCPPAQTFTNGLAWVFYPRQNEPTDLDGKSPFPSWSWASRKAAHGNVPIGALNTEYCIPLHEELNLGIKVELTHAKTSPAFTLGLTSMPMPLNSNSFCPKIMVKNSSHQNEKDFVWMILCNRRSGKYWAYACARNQGT